MYKKTTILWAVHFPYGSGKLPCLLASATKTLPRKRLGKKENPTLLITRKIRENKRKKIIRPLLLMFSLDHNSGCSLVPSDRAELKEVHRNPARKLRGWLASTNDQLHKLWLFSRERYALSPVQERPMKSWGARREWEATTLFFHRQRGGHQIQPAGASKWLDEVGSNLIQFGFYLYYLTEF